jgi:hypothetical protein
LISISKTLAVFASTSSLTAAAVGAADGRACSSKTMAEIAAPMQATPTGLPPLAIMVGPV